MVQSSTLDDLSWVRRMSEWSSTGPGESPPPLPKYEDIGKYSTLRDVVLERKPVDFAKVRELALDCFHVLSTVARKLPAEYLSRVVSPANFATNHTMSGRSRVSLIGFIRRGWEESNGQVTCTELYRIRAAYYQAPELDVNRSDREKPLVFSIAMMIYQLAVGGDPFFAEGRQDFIQKCSKVRIPADLDHRFKNVFLRLFDVNPGSRPGFKEAIALLAEQGPLRGLRDRADSKVPVEGEQDI